MEDSAQRRWSVAVRCAIRDIAAEPDNMTRRGWSSFADTRQITFLKTIGEDQRIRHFLAAVCRRRWPSGRRRQAIQRPMYLLKAICRAIQTGAAEIKFQREADEKEVFQAERGCVAEEDL